jgi:hypothetical protein
VATPWWETSGAFTLYGVLAGTVSTYLVTRRSITAAAATAKERGDLDRDLAQKEHAHELELAATKEKHERQLNQNARKQQRWEDSYVDLVVFLNKWSEIASLTKTGWSLDPAEDPQKLPPDEEVERTQARVEAFASPRVRDAMSEWLSVRSDFVRARTVAEGARRRSQVENVSPDYAEVSEVSQRLLDAGKTVKELAREDLHGEA